MSRRTTTWFVMGALAVVFASATTAQPQTQTLTLHDCIGTALLHNPQLVSSEQSVVSAHNGLRQVRSGYAPQLTLKASEGVHGSSGGGTAASGDGASLILGMTVWDSGKKEAIAQSRANVLAASSSHDDRRLSIAKLVADDYFAVLAAAELVGVARAGVEYAEAHRRQVAAQIEQGAVAAVEIHTVDADLAQARLSLIDARAVVRAALAALKTDMGLPQTTDLQLAPHLIGAERPLPTEAEAFETALAQRPDLQSQKAFVEARRHSVQLAKIARGPMLEVSGSANRQYPDWDSGNSSWGLSAGVTWPLLDGGYTAAAHSTARANLISSEADLRSLVDQAALEVQNALIDLERAQERIKTAEEALNAATARLHSAEVKYREGLGILIEVTQARQDFTSAEAEVVRARFSYQVAQIALQRATATLLLPAGEGELTP